MLPAPAKKLTAQIGVDSRAGGGSVVFSVEASGKELFRSNVLHGGEAAVPMEVDLGGANEFTLEVGDAGDGISCDQSNWAEAKVETNDGRAYLLGDLPIVEQELPQRSAWSIPFSFQYGGKTSDEILPGWKFSQTTKKLDANRTQTTQTYTDPNSGLQMKCVMVRVQRFPHSRMDASLQEHGQGRYSHSFGHTRAGHADFARKGRRVRFASDQRRLLHAR